MVMHDGKRLAAYALAIFLLTLVARLPLALSLSPPQVSGTESINLASSLALHGTYSDALGQDTGPTAHLLPGGVALPALALTLFGFGKVGVVALIVLSCLEVAAGLALLPAVGLLLLGEAR